MAKRTASEQVDAAHESKHAKTGHDKGDDGSSDGLIKKASLLGLPAELRNKGLLRTNRQIRDETKSIFQQENNMFIEIVDLHLAPHSYHWAWNLGGQKLAEINYQGSYSWTNLRDWLAKLREDDTTPLLDGPVGRDPSGDVKTVGEIFGLARGLFKAGTGWEMVEAMLASFRRVLEAKGAAAKWIE